MTNARHLLLVALLVLSAVAPATVAGADAGVGVAQQTTTPTENTTTNGTQTGGGPTQAVEARITAVSFDKSYLRVRRTGEDQWNTTGAYAVFSVSETVSAVRIAQPNAQAKLLDGGRTIRVSFDPGAAPEGSVSFYKVEVFFADDSKRTLTIYARDTEQVVVSPSVKESGSLIEVLREDAKAHGYGTSVDELIAYHEWEREQADLLNSLFSEQFARFFGWLILTVRTPFALIALALVFIYLLWRVVQSHGWKLAAQLNGDNRRETTIRSIKENYRRQQLAADEKSLEDIEQIGPLWVHWQSQYNVSTVRQLASLFKDGQRLVDGEGNILRNEDADPFTDENGEVVTTASGEPLHPARYAHRGVADLVNAEDLSDTWLEPLLRNESLGSGTAALAHARAALTKITTEFGQSEYEETRAIVNELLEREGGKDTSPVVPRHTSAGHGTTGAVGGSDD